MIVFSIPLSELEISYARSSGPGGQNVNKVNSKAVLRWNLDLSSSIPAHLKGWMRSRLGSKLTNEGDLLITSDRFRDQLKNREDCIEKLHALLSAAADRPKPRKKTKPSFSSIRRAKEEKRHRSARKALRSRPRDD